MALTSDKILKILKKTKAALDSESKKRKITEYDLGYDWMLMDIIEKVEQNIFSISRSNYKKTFADMNISSDYKYGMTDCIDFYDSVVSFVDKVENPL